MVAKRQGKQWTKKEDKLLKEMFLNCFSYKEMGKELDRSWFACKCRLARLGLIQPFRNTEEQFYVGTVEPYVVPNGLTIQTFEFESGIEEEEDTSNTFSNAELNIVTDWFKTRLSRVVCKLADGTENMVVLADLNMCRDFLEQEIKIVNNMKKITVEEREKVCRRLC